MTDLTTVLAQLQDQRKQAKREVEKLDEAVAAITRLVARNGAGRTGAGRGRRRLSVAARKRISMAQKARWAKVRAKQEKKAA
jgi:hypothetical protein